MQQNQHMKSYNVYKSNHNGPQYSLTVRIYVRKLIQGDYNIMFILNSNDNGPRVQ